MTLRRTETRVWNAFCLGQELDLQAWDAHRPGLGFGAVVRTSRAPAVRAQVLAAMLRGDRGSGQNPRLVLSGAHVVGQLDLSYARIGHPIILRRCVFDEPITVSEGRLNSLILDGSVFPGLDAHNLELDGNLGLRHVSCSHTVNLQGARFHRDVQLQGARLGQRRSDAQALVADHMTVDGSVHCDGGLQAIGAISVVGVRVRGTVRLDHAKILPADGQEAAHATDGQEAAHATDGQEKAHATDGQEKKVAFNGEGMTIGREFSAHHVTALGEVRLVDATITSTLELRGARLENPGGVVLRLDRAEILSSLYCDKDFIANGEVCAIGTHVKGTAYFNDAHVGTDAASSADAPNPSRSRVALRLVRVTIDGDLGIWRNFTSYGRVILTRAVIGGELTLLTTNLKGDVAADLTNARIGALTITGEPPTGILDLTKVRTDVFSDNPERWRDRGRIVLNGLEYTSIHMDQVTLEDRYQWLRRGIRETKAERGGYYDPRYLAQPYEQLAQAYRRVGDDHAARRLLLEKCRQHNRATPWRQWYTKIWYFMQDVLVGYGYTPFRALIWLAALLLLGTGVFRYVVQPVWISAPPHRFGLGDSVSYTLDLLMPVSSLSDRQIWHSANGVGEFLASALVVFGWILGATVVAGAARVLQRS
jgi:hypothetical protein